MYRVYSNSRCSNSRYTECHCCGFTTALNRVSHYLKSCALNRFSGHHALFDVPNDNTTQVWQTSRAKTGWVWLGYILLWKAELWNSHLLVFLYHFRCISHHYSQRAKMFWQPEWQKQPFSEFRTLHTNDFASENISILVCCPISFQSTYTKAWHKGGGWSWRRWQFCSRTRRVSTWPASTSTWPTSTSTWPTYLG